MKAAEQEQGQESRWRWIGPLASVVVLAAVGFVLHRELSHLHVKDVIAQLHAIADADILAALAFMAINYCVLSGYDFLALRYLRKPIRYTRILLTSFIAYAFGHNLGFGALTGAAVRFRLYSPAGLMAADIATMAGFCSLTTGLGLATLGGLSLLLKPEQAALVLHLHVAWAITIGALLLAAVLAYILWCLATRASIEIRGWFVSVPRPAVAVLQVCVAVVDISLASSVLWWLLPADVHVGFITFVGIYVAAVTAGIVSHVPGGLGVFESVIILTLPQMPLSALLGSILIYRAVYYLLPLSLATILFGIEELRTRGGPIVRAHKLASAYLAPVVPQVAGTLTFVAGVVLLISGATPGIDARIAALRHFLPLAILEISHLAGSITGLGLIVLARALFHRVQAAYHITFWLLIGGIVASLLKGLDYEEAILLTLVLWVLVLGRRAFYRPTSILAARFTPMWAVGVAAVIAIAAWIPFIVYRHVEYSQELWWTFARDANAPRALRATVVVVVLAAAYLLRVLLRPARPEPGIASDDDLQRAAPIITQCDSTLANAAYTGDKRLLFNDSGDAFVMYQVMGRSWIALGDPVGPVDRAEELVWRFRELSDFHGGRTVFYQASGDRLPLYVDLGLSALKIGEEARVPLEGFSLAGGERADLRQAHKRAARDGASFEIVPVEALPQMLPDLKRISDFWLAGKSVAEKRFSVGAFSEEYLRHFPIAVVRSEGTPSAFANLWLTGTKDELSVDLIRFGQDAPRGAMDFLFIELMLWGQTEGYRWFNLGMAPLAGLEQHPLAPAWHRVGNFVFRYGEHFYNFDGLRRYKTKFDPVWEPKYLVARGGLALPRILMDVSMLISGGMRELFAR